MANAVDGIDWDKVGRLAKTGMRPKEAMNVSKLCHFVQGWSGGSKGEILSDLESYEKTLHHKRSILADDLQVLAECDAQFERIVPASTTQELAHTIR